MPKYKHADILAAVAEAAKTSETPWDVVEVKDHKGGGGDYYPIEDMDSLGWFMYVGRQLRIKPPTQTINEFEVPGPVRTPLEYGRDYYWPALESLEYFRPSCWTGDKADMLRLERGLIHLTAEAAISNTKAMLGIDPKEEK